MQSSVNIMRREEHRDIRLLFAVNKKEVFCEKTIALMLVIVLCIVNLTACGSSEESKPSVYSVGDVLNFSNSNGEEYSVCITDWGTSDGWKYIGYFFIKNSYLVSICDHEYRR